MVVGGTRGTGRALVKRLIDDDGYRVSSIGRQPDRELESPKLAQYAVDVSDRATLRSCIEEAVARFGRLGCVVFMQRNRGGDDDFDTDLAVAVSATRFVVDHLVGGHLFADEGHQPSMVFVSSIADHFVAPEQPVGYHVAKAGLAQMARYYALALGPRGIRVNVVSPCVVVKDEAREFYDKNEWLVDRFNRFIPLGRPGRPSDIVNAILFLASAQASYITGQNIVVDGGLTLLGHESIVRDIPREG
jgi:NAD(P)-dependent dehydrogenase (short-subunit alcohol dehydrogenase family)